MNKEQYVDYRTLQRAGVEVGKRNQIRFNGGSETVKHFVSKCLVGYIGQLNGYRVSSEVQTDHGDVDVLLWGHPDRLTLAVEAETSPTERVVKDKLRRYVEYHEPVDDMILINVNEVPMDMIDAAHYIATELGLGP